MPKKLHTNPKAQEARERKDTEKKAKAAKESKAGSTAKEKRAAAKEAKAAADREKKAQKKALEEADNDVIKKDIKPKGKMDNKVTRVAIMSMAERRELEAAEEREEAEKKKQRIIDQIALEENFNRKRQQERAEDEERFGADNIVEASGIDAGVAALRVAGGKEEKKDRHPEKRMKAAFAEYKEQQMPILKKENPTLKHTQLHELLWENWQKAPQNPKNEVADS